MFDKKRFAQIIKNISDTYDNQRIFAEKSEINRTYLSQYMNMKLDEPPKPKTLQKLSIASNGITTYTELMKVCGYTDSNLLEVESLKEFYEQLEENFLDLLSSIKLSKEENEVYNDLCMIVDIFSFKNQTENEIKEEITPYFNNMDYLSKSSKEKVQNKLLFFIQYVLQTEKLKDKIFSIKHSESKINSGLSLETNKTSNFYMTPVYGRISAGQPNWVEECIEGRIPIDPDMMNITNPEKCFFLRVNGESMNKEIKNGAYALIRKTDFVENGEIAVVLVNGFDATLKKFSKQGDLIILEPMSTDASFTTQVYNKDTEIKVIGKYIGKMEMK